MHDVIQAALPPNTAWTIIPAYRLTRLRRHIDAVLLTDRAVLAFATTRAQAEAAALDLADFHEGCRDVPVLPIALLQGEHVVAQRPLPFPGAAPPIACTRLLLPALLDSIRRFPPVPSFDPAAWEHARYRPVPALMEAACQLYARHGAAHLQLTRTDGTDLAQTQSALAAALAKARAGHDKRIVFVTGHPGAGKTLCGLDLAFTPGANATFLTANPALLHVLRAALVRDAASRGLAPRAARQRVHSLIQPLHAFRDHHAHAAAAPPDRLLVIDEAQRCWTAVQALRKTRNKAQTLTQSEPALLLDIMVRHEGHAAIVCLIGGGQEIHAGEGGLAAWGHALATRPMWHVHAPATSSPDPRQTLPALPNLTRTPTLHLGRPIRAHRAPTLVAWVDAMLANTPVAAAKLAPTLPIALTRSLAVLRAHTHAPGKRCGLLASSAARRLRAEGLGGLLWHQDEDAVARWFLDAWPDIRSADALEVAATEFGAQGLELDRAGLCWDQDLARTPDMTAWQARAFRATAWTLPRTLDALPNKLNAYRVLLTRARDHTVVWVPRGDARDPTRDPARYDAVAAYLQSCGLKLLDATTPSRHSPAKPEPLLL